MYRFVFFCGILCISSCHRVENVIEQGAETAGKAAGSIAQHLGSGVEQALSINPVLSPQLAATGLQLGKTLINSDGEGTDNKLSIYCIASGNTDLQISARVQDAKGQELGRTTSRLQLDSGQTKYLEFFFERYTNIDSDSKVFLDVQ
ncbi:MAG: hypothetical protein RL160_1571 [Bacteroidota bacterium]